MTVTTEHDLEETLGGETAVVHAEAAGGVVGGGGEGAFYLEVGVGGSLGGVLENYSVLNFGDEGLLPLHSLEDVGGQEHSAPRQYRLPLHHFLLGHLLSRLLLLGC